MSLRPVTAKNLGPPVSGPGWGGRITRAEVNLDAVRGNLAAVRRLVEPAAVMAVVKADGYGHGAAAIAEAAGDAGAGWLGVYTPSEALTLRSAGVELPILVFGPFAPAEAEALARHSITPTIHSVEAVRVLARVAGGRPVAVHIKVDTGLSRAGVAPAEVASLVSVLQDTGTLALEGLYTHLARADEPDKGPTYRQLAIFESVAREITSTLGYRPLLHAANTAATLDVPESRLDLVRVGIGTYGYYPSVTCGRPIPLTPALNLVSAVTRVTRIPKGTGVGYGHEFVAPRPTEIALVPIGYGDGLPRTLGNGTGTVLIHGRLVPIVGRVSMDQITVDVTGVGDVHVGDEAVLVGAQGEAVQTADDLGRQAGTISYDIITRLLPRVPRLYVSGEHVIADADGNRTL